MPFPPQVHAHKRIAETANALCNELYDIVMSNNQVYAEWRRQHPGASEKGLRMAFLKANINRCVEPARATLAGMLALPYDEELKIEIHEALVLDSELKAGRAAGLRVVGKL